MMLFICEKGKDDFLSGAVAAPPTYNPKYKAWKSKHSMVMSWLLNSMTKEIGEDFMMCFQSGQENNQLRIFHNMLSTIIILHH